VGSARVGSHLLLLPDGLVSLGRDLEFARDDVVVVNSVHDRR
jgi:hypothetical protein